MKTFGLSMLTICGIEELLSHQQRNVTHVLSLLDPGTPEIDAFGTYGEHDRVTLQFHDIIEPEPGKIVPTPDDVTAVLAFGKDFAATAKRTDGHLLVHCHQGISRSTAAMLAVMAQASPAEDEDRPLARLREIRPGPGRTR